MYILQYLLFISDSYSRSHGREVFRNTTKRVNDSTQVVFLKTWNDSSRIRESE